MNIRIAGQTQLGPVENPRPAAARSGDADSKSTETATPENGSDHADISSASGLLALAKSAVPAGRQEKLAELAARVGSNQYRPPSSEISRSIVEGLLKK